MDLKAVVISGEAPESDDDASNIVTVCNIYHCIIFRILNVLNLMQLIKKNIVYNFYYTQGLGFSTMRTPSTYCGTIISGEAPESDDGKFY